MSRPPDILYCFVKRGHAVHYHSDRTVFEKWLKKSPWLYPSTECEIIEYRPSLRRRIAAAIRALKDVGE